MAASLAERVAFSLMRSIAVDRLRHQPGVSPSLLLSVPSFSSKVSAGIAARASSDSPWNSTGSERGQLTFRLFCPKAEILVSKVIFGHSLTDYST